MDKFIFSGSLHKRFKFPLWHATLPKWKGFIFFYKGIRIFTTLIMCFVV